MIALQCRQRYPQLILTILGTSSYGTVSTRNRGSPASPWHKASSLSWEMARAWKSVHESILWSAYGGYAFVIFGCCSENFIMAVAAASHCYIWCSIRHGLIGKTHDRSRENTCTIICNKHNNLLCIKAFHVKLWIHSGQKNIYAPFLFQLCPSTSTPWYGNAVAWRLLLAIGRQNQILCHDGWPLCISLSILAERRYRSFFFGKRV